MIKKITNNKNLRYILATSLFSSFLSVASAGLNFLINIYIARNFETTVFASYSYIFSLIAVLSMLTTFGTNQYLLLNIPKLSYAKKEILIAKVNVFILIATVFISTALFFLLSDNDYSIQSKLFILVTYILATFMLIRQAVLFAESKVVLSQLWDKCMRLVIFIVLLFTFGFFGGAEIFDSLDIVMGGMFLSYLLAFLGLQFLYKKIFPVSFIKQVFLSKNEMKESLLLFGVVIGTTILSNIDVLFLGHFGSASDVAYYSAAQKISLVGGMFLISMTNIITPKLVKLNGGNNMDFEKFSQMLTWGGFCSIMLFALLTFFWGDRLLRLFGHEFVNGHLTLILLVVASLVSSSFGQSLTVMKVKNESKKLALFIIFALLCKMLIMIPLYDLYGFNGVAASTIVAVLVWSVLCTFHLIRVHSINTTIFKAILLKRI